MKEYDSINPENLPDDSQELIDLVQKIHSIGEKLSYRELSMEGYYQELLSQTHLTEDEELLFSIMEQTRETFNRIEESFRERQAKNPWANTELGKRLGLRYCDWDSRPIFYWEYHFKHAYFPKHVGEDLINGYRISTVWMGLDHAFFKDGDPVIFETMIFKEDKELPENEELDYYQERYSYLKEAEEGHQEACQRVKELTK